MCLKLCATPSNTTRRLLLISEGEDLVWGTGQADPRVGGEVMGKDLMMIIQTLGEDIPDLLPSSKGMDGEDIS